MGKIEIRPFSNFAPVLPANVKCPGLEERIPYDLVPTGCRCNN